MSKIIFNIQCFLLRLIAGNKAFIVNADIYLPDMCVYQFNNLWTINSCIRNRQTFIGIERTDVLNFNIFPKYLYNQAFEQDKNDVAS